MGNPRSNHLGRPHAKLRRVLVAVTQAGHPKPKMSPRPSQIPEKNLPSREPQKRKLVTVKQAERTALTGHSKINSHGLAIYVLTWFKKIRKHRCQVARGHHLRNFHAADRKFTTHAFLEKADFFPVSDLPKERRAWTCHNCQLGLHFLAGESFRKSRAAHVKACTGLTPKELMYVRLRTKESREICRQRPNALVAQRKQAALEAMEDLSASTGRQLVMLPFATSGRSWSFTCAACTLTRPTLADIRKSGKRSPC